jgi:hypothetical protein
MSINNNHLGYELFKRSSVAAILAAATLGFSTPPASATVVDKDVVKLGLADAPATFDGILSFDQRLKGDHKVTYFKVSLDGKVTYKGNGDTGCARVRVNIYDVEGNLVSGPQFSDDACGNGSMPSSVDIAMPRNKDTAHKVAITLRVRVGGTVSNVAKKNFYLGDAIEGVI